METKKLVPEFEESLFNNSESTSEKLKKIKSGNIKIGIDSVLESGLIEEIPILKTLLNVKEFAHIIYNRNLMQQTIIFINEFNSGKCDKEKLRRHREKLNKDPSFAEKELGRVLILLNSVWSTTPQT